MRVLVALAAFATATALQAAVPQVNTATAFDRLSGCTLTSAKTAEAVALTSLWRNTPLPIGNDRCVVEFLRHFG